MQMYQTSLLKDGDSLIRISNQINKIYYKLFPRDILKTHAVKRLKVDVDGMGREKAWKGWEKIRSANIHKKAGVATLISDKINFIKDKES